jgi:SAM-dependent methyltransferase
MTGSEEKSKLSDMALRVVQRFNRFAVMSQALARIEKSLAAVESSLVANQASMLELANEQQELRRMLRELEAQRRAEPVPAANPSFDIAQTLAALRTQHPSEFALWEQLTQNAEAEYRRIPAHSLSVKGNRVAADFRLFARRYLNGRVLDIGCGRQDVPLYLEGYPTQSIAAIDPFGGAGDHPFLFVPAINEELPWPDATFDTVINATSLDHCIDLEKSLQETARVMNERATFLVWVGFIPGAAPYVTGKAGPKPVDGFHLYHFDKPWFEDLMARLFLVIEHADIDLSSNFYAFRKLPTSDAKCLPIKHQLSATDFLRDMRG